MQLESFPCRVVEYQPFPRQFSAYANGRAVGEDGLPYIVKGFGGPSSVPATEFLCTSLAEFLNLPIAPFKVLVMPNGELVFGSEILPACLTEVEQVQVLFSDASKNDLVLPSLRPLLSQLYAFDLIIGNVDRHPSNFLFSIESTTENTRMARLRALDFDQADLVTRDRITLPLSPNSHTVTTARLIRNVHTFDSKSAVDMLTRFDRGREVMVERALLGLPTEWLSSRDRDNLMKKVGAAAFSSEIGQLQQGLSNGDYL